MLHAKMKIKQKITQTEKGKRARKSAIFVFYWELKLDFLRGFGPI